jgi:hypothetical protein
MFEFFGVALYFYRRIRVPRNKLPNWRREIQGKRNAPCILEDAVLGTPIDE